MLKRIAKARDMLASSCQTDDSRRGKLSDDCSAALIDMLGKAREQCRSWRDTF